MKMNDFINAAKQGITDRQPDKPITAGGPGSGRKPGFGSGTQQRMHSFLTKAGYDHVGTKDGTMHYQHPDGHTASTKSNGDWEHTLKRPYGLNTERGNGSRELTDHVLEELGI